MSDSIFIGKMTKEKALKRIEHYKENGWENMEVEGKYVYSEECYPDNNVCENLTNFINKYSDAILELDDEFEIIPLGWCDLELVAHTQDRLLSVEFCINEICYELWTDAKREKQGELDINDDKQVMELLDWINE